MRSKLPLFLIAFAASAALSNSASGQIAGDVYISPSRPVPTGKAPAMQVKLVKDAPEERSTPWSSIRATRHSAA